MIQKKLTTADVARAQRIWAEYQQEHEIKDKIGKSVGIDPSSGRIWFGESIVDVVQQLEREGLEMPLFFVRAGSDYYFRKGRRR